MILEVDRVIPVGIQRHQLRRSILQPGGGDRFFRDFVHTRQQVLQDGAACAVRPDLVYRMTVRSPDGENSIRHFLAAVRVMLIDDEIGPLVIFQNDLAGLAGEQLHMVLLQVTNVV